MIFNQGGNAVDAACAMLAATSTMWDTLGWGGETQALIYDPRQKKVVGINALGVAPTGATAEFFEQQGLDFPPEFGPQAGVTPGTPGGLLVMLRDYGTMSLEQVLAPAIEMADGYPMEEQAANSIERAKESIKEWPYSRDIYLPHLGEEREAPYGGEIFRQPDLATTLRKMVDAEQEALIGGATREAAIQSAYDRFYRGDIAEEFVRGSQEMGGLHTMEDLANWEVYIEEPVKTSYKGIDVYKLTTLGSGAGDVAGAEHPREPRSAVDGLQLVALHARHLPGDEPGVCRSRLLLRRSVLPAGRAHRRAALEGLREAAHGAHWLGEQRRRRATG